jgi:hypothetical protein
MVDDGDLFLEIGNVETNDDDDDNDTFKILKTKMKMMYNNNATHSELAGLR